MNEIDYRGYIMHQEIVSIAIKSVSKLVIQVLSHKPLFYYLHKIIFPKILEKYS